MCTSDFFYRECLHYLTCYVKCTVTFVPEYASDFKILFFTFKQAFQVLQIDVATIFTKTPSGYQQPQGCFEVKFLEISVSPSSGI